MPVAPEGYAAVNPFIITRRAEALLEFLVDVFGAVERPDARTVDTDGLLLHSEVELGGSTIAVAHRKPGWPFTPSLLQVWVDDLDETLTAARDRGATIVTEPTPFFGDTFSRFRDPWDNLWWVYRHDPSAVVEWSAEAESSEVDTDEAAWAPTPELTYIHDTLLTAMAELRDRS
ncbi:putative conserved protein PhnB, glyoxalase superfamily [Prauserella aidingensis]|uniref:VOC family protein n=1 Tax=Prauserella aidingensis TaxID=387890 RepID=UPI0020A28FD0|nr:VOC family protein [Prauserella aidingensis]MCP2256206.1 putative conserved protein PhnB, glyoxalase superfamily [Prauserella aidingensis]